MDRVLDDYAALRRRLQPLGGQKEDLRVGLGPQDVPAQDPADSLAPAARAGGSGKKGKAKKSGVGNSP